MERKTKIEYIRYYTPGSEARVLEPLYPERRDHPRKKTHAPVQPSPKVVTVTVDPLSLAAVVLAVLMAVLMVAGVNRLESAQQELEAMAGYVQRLEEKNAELIVEFENGYVLEDVEKAALSQGMVSVEGVAHIQVQMAPVLPEPEPEMTAVDRLYQFFLGLFA